MISRFNWLVIGLLVLFQSGCSNRNSHNGGVTSQTITAAQAFNMEIVQDEFDASDFKDGEMINTAAFELTSKMSLSISSLDFFVQHSNVNINGVFVHVLSNGNRTILNQNGKILDIQDKVKVDFDTPLVLQQGEKATFQLWVLVSNVRNIASIATHLNDLDVQAPNSNIMSLDRPLRRGDVQSFPPVRVNSGGSVSSDFLIYGGNEMMKIRIHSPFEDSILNSLSGVINKTQGVVIERVYILDEQRTVIFDELIDPMMSNTTQLHLSLDLNRVLAAGNTQHLTLGIVVTNNLSLGDFINFNIIGVRSTFMSNNKTTYEDISISGIAKIFQ